MVEHEPAYLINEIFRKLQPPHYPLGKQSAAFSVTLEMPAPVFVKRHTIGFAQVVKQHSKAYGRLGQCVSHRLAGMHPYGKIVVRRTLVAVDTRLYFGEDILQNIGVLLERTRREFSHNDTLQLLADRIRVRVIETRDVRAHTVSGLLLYLVLVLGAVTYSLQQP